MGYIICAEPPGFGFGNRLYQWEAMYEIAKRNKMRVACNWPELKWISLPLTDRKEIGRACEFDSRKTIELDPAQNYRDTAGWDFTRQWDRAYGKERPIQLMELKDADLLANIKATLCDNTIGVHIRRGDYYPMAGFRAQSNWRLCDSWYFHICGQILKRYPDVRFYLSTDGTAAEVCTFIRAFSPMMASAILNPNDMAIPAIPHSLNLPGIVDFFALAHCRLIVCSQSTWSMAAVTYRRAPAIWPKCEDQDISEELKALV